jgi:hypothetical protein
MRESNVNLSRIQIASLVLMPFKSHAQQHNVHDTISIIASTMQTILMRSSVIIILLLTVPISSHSQQALKPTFSHPEIIRYDRDAFIIHGRDTFLFSGSFHYFRCDPSEWMDRLKKIKAAGINAIDAYVPWNFHEQIEGKTDFNQLTGFWITAGNGTYVSQGWALRMW